MFKRFKTAQQIFHEDAIILYGNFISLTQQYQYTYKPLSSKIFLSQVQWSEVCSFCASVKDPQCLPLKFQMTYNFSYHHLLLLTIFSPVMLLKAWSTYLHFLPTISSDCNLCISFFYKVHSISWISLLYDHLPITILAWNQSICEVHALVGLDDETKLPPSVFCD